MFQVDKKEEEILRYEAEIKNTSQVLERHQQQMDADSEKVYWFLVLDSEFSTPIK